MREKENDIKNEAMEDEEADKFNIEEEEEEIAGSEGRVRKKRKERV